VTDYTGLWKLLYDWQTISAGGLAVLAAVIGGGMAYWAGRVQANATRTAADLQVAAADAQLAHLKAEKKEADQRADTDRQKREITQINITISAISYNIEALLHIVTQYIIPHHTDSHKAYADLRRAVGDPKSAAEFAATSFPSTYPALVTTCPEIHFREWNFLKELPFVVEKDPELLKQSDWLISQSRDLATAIKNRNHNIVSAMRITTQQGGLKLAELGSVLHLQTSLAESECITSLQLFNLFVEIEKKLEIINNTYVLEAKKSTLTMAKPFETVIDRLREIAKETRQFQTRDRDFT
jgi:hypothetical protein